MLVDHLPGVVVVALMENLLPGDVHHRAARQGQGFSTGNARMRPVHGPGHGEPLAVAKRRVDGEPALLHVGQQMGKVALNGEQPLMLTKRIAQRRVRMVQRGQRRGRLCIQPGVVLNETTNHGRRGAHGSHPG